jgi:hypothetical protein
MKKVNAPQYEFSALPFNLAGEEAIDGAEEQARLDALEADRLAAMSAQQNFEWIEAELGSCELDDVRDEHYVFDHDGD